MKDWHKLLLDKFGVAKEVSGQIGEARKPQEDGKNERRWLKKARRTKLP